MEFAADCGFDAVRAATSTTPTATASCLSPNLIASALSADATRGDLRDGQLLALYNPLTWSPKSSR
jgi:hypothetical protein